MKKKLIKAMVAGTLFASLLSFAGCGSTPKADPTIKVNVDDDVDKVVVIDWTDRTLGEISAPTWLKNMTRGNSDTFKEQWSISADRVVKFSRATGKTEAIAQALSRAGFAYTQAAELNQKVIGRVGQGLNDVGQLEALFVAASETKADMAGLREEAGFFQKVRTTNAETGAKTEQYIYYTIYSMSKDTWDALCKKYLMDMMGGANLETETQKKIGALFSEMKADADKKDAQKQAEEKRAYDAQMARLETEKTKAIEQTATAKLNAQEAQAKQAAAEADLLASYLM
ncbi:MAG: hypothetical protein MR739_08485 [Spirochaetia bacterium]|nr:hypothetical protein [Spirochaetia bacterium]